VKGALARNAAALAVAHNHPLCWFRAVHPAGVSLHRLPKRATRRLPRRRGERRGCAVHADVSVVRALEDWDHADGCVPVLLRMRALPCGAAPEAEWLLRVLLVRIGAVSTGAAAGKALRL